MPSKDKEPKHIIIVGGGVSALLYLDNLRQHAVHSPQLLPLQVEILEAGDKFASGLPWDPDNLRPFHKMNTYTPVPNDITRAVEANPKRYEKYLPLDAHGEHSRLLTGEFFRQGFEVAVASLRRAGVTVKLSPNTVADDLYKEGNDFLVSTRNTKTGNHTEKTADYVILATGHWQNKSAINDNKGIFASPWPASRLENEVDLSKPVAVLGTSLSAVDAILTMAHHGGTFEREGGKMKFTPHNDKLHITALSPHGMLPPVLGCDNEDGLLPHAPLRPEPDASGLVSLDDVYRHISRFFLEQYKPESGNPQYKAVKAVMEYGSLRVEDAVNAFYREYAKDPLGFLQEQVKEARDSLDTGKPIFWQEYLRRMVGGIERCYNDFSAEDQERFLNHVRPLYAKLAYGMVLSNAEEIQAVLESGCLEVKALGDNYSLATRQEAGEKLPGAEICYVDSAGREQRKYFPGVVKAMGDDLYKLKASSPLMEKMFKSGIVREMLAPYRDQAKGKAEFEREKTLPGESRITRFLHGKYYRSNGGIEVEKSEALPGDDYLIKAVAGRYHSQPERGGAEKSEEDMLQDLLREEQTNLFALGEPVACHAPLHHGFGVMKRSAQEIANTISARILYQRGVGLSPGAIVDNTEFAGLLRQLLSGENR